MATAAKGDSGMAERNACMNGEMHVTNCTEYFAVLNLYYSVLEDSEFV